MTEEEKKSFKPFLPPVLENEPEDVDWPDPFNKPDTGGLDPIEGFAG